MKKHIIILLTLQFFSLVYSTSAQNLSRAITTENIARLRSVLHVDFADFVPIAGKIENGWFALDATATHLAVTNRASEVVVWADNGQVIDKYSVPASDNLPATMLDMAFRKDLAELVTVHAEGGAYYVVYRDYNLHLNDYFRFLSADVPLRIWDSGQTWLEVSPVDYTRSRFVQRLSPVKSDIVQSNEVLSPEELYELPSGPENDPDSFLRIGRIEPPFAITITQNFLVKRWNLETGEVTATGQLDTLPGAGQLSLDGRYFAWRDGESKGLHLLDFETGNDRVIASLRESYIPFLLLNSSSSVIIGVNVDLMPIIVAWDTITGEKIELGEYRSCGRQPDMVRLSNDDTTVVIGCDKGLDIWRVGDSGS